MRVEEGRVRTWERRSGEVWVGSHQHSGRRDGCDCLSESRSVELEEENEAHCC